MSDLLLNLGNPLLLIAPGINYSLRSGGGTQLAPSLGGAGNPAIGQPVTAPTTYGFTPPYPPFPAASGPGLATFTIKRAGGIQLLYFQGSGFSAPCGTGLAYGTLVSGGGTNGAVLHCIQAQSGSSGPPGLFCVVLLLPSPASNAFPTNPFTHSTWNTISFTTSGTDTPANTTYNVGSAGLPFTAGGTQIGGYTAQWGQSGYSGTTLPTVYTANETLTFTVS